MKYKAGETHCTCVAGGGGKAEGVHLPNLNCFHELWEMSLRLGRSRDLFLRVQLSPLVMTCCAAVAYCAEILS